MRVSFLSPKEQSLRAINDVRHIEELEFENHGIAKVKSDTATMCELAFTISTNGIVLGTLSGILANWIWGKLQPKNASENIIVILHDDSGIKRSELDLADKKILADQITMFLDQEG
ncbi:hypothetical protein [Sphingorhabdus sp. Alg231-15]|uniref:hypothetical protein n=1 Tax=Sphingorhabdus sp. Alg231-15 TaxID=1922222 RepID=UPI000D54F522